MSAALLKTRLFPHELNLTTRSHIAPGGYIEQSESFPKLTSDDGSIPSGDILQRAYDLAAEASQAFGKNVLVAPLIKNMIREAGFVNVVEKQYKWPIGEWPVDRRLKDIGRWNMKHWLEGLDAWTLRIFTQHCGVSEPLCYVATLDSSGNQSREVMTDD